MNFKNLTSLPHLVDNLVKNVNELGWNIYKETHITKPPCFTYESQTAV